MERNILSVRNLSISFNTGAREIKAVRGISFDVAENETLAIVGESGSGKSVTVHSILGLTPTPPAAVKSGEIILDGIDILKLDEKQLEAVRKSIAGISFQNTLASLNPTMQIGRQIAEAIPEQTRAGWKGIMDKAAGLMQLVQIPDPHRRARQYPHELSGGMRQRALIAMALAKNPRLLILDEPTTSLDVTIQAQILELIKDIRRKSSTAIVIVTHDMGVVAGLAQKIIVMYAGRIVEYGTSEDIFYNPGHPYTIGLLNSIPGLEQDRNQELSAIEGAPPGPSEPLQGCAFAARCKYCMNICLKTEPDMLDAGGRHKCACWLLHHQAKNNMNVRSEKDE